MSPLDRLHAATDVRFRGKATAPVNMAAHDASSRRWGDRYDCAGRSVLAATTGISWRQHVACATATSLVVLSGVAS